MQIFVFVRSMDMGHICIVLNDLLQQDMNNKSNISFSKLATLLIIAILVMASWTGLIAVAQEMMGSNENVLQEEGSKSAIPNFDFDNNLLLDSSVQEAFDGVVKNHFTQKPVNSRTTITSQNTAISIDFNCPDRTSKAVLVPEPTIFPTPILKLIPTYVGTDFHEIEFSLHGAFNKLNDQGCAGLEFDFSGSTKFAGNTKCIGPLEIVIV